MKQFYCNEERLAYLKEQFASEATRERALQILWGWIKSETFGMKDLVSAMRLFGENEHESSTEVLPSIPRVFFDRSFTTEVLPSTPNFPCRDCGCGNHADQDNVTFAPDPYEADLHNDQTPVWMCEECRRQSAREL